MRASLWSVFASEQDHSQTDTPDARCQQNHGRFSSQQVPRYDGCRAGEQEATKYGSTAVSYQGHSPAINQSGEAIRLDYASSRPRKAIDRWTRYSDSSQVVECKYAETFAWLLYQETAFVSAQLRRTRRPASS